MLTPLGVIALEHNVDLYSLQEKSKIASANGLFTGSLSRVGDSVESTLHERSHENMPQYGMRNSIQVN